jgi:hypothetical protein
MEQVGERAARIENKIKGAVIRSTLPNGPGGSMIERPDSGTGLSYASQQT